MIYKLAVSVGEPAGIGPDQILLLSQQDFYYNNPGFVLILFCDPELLKTRAQILDIDIKLITVDIKAINKVNNIINFIHQKGVLYIASNSNLITHTTNTAYLPGVLNQANAANIIEYLNLATLSCLQQQCDAIITCPINKHIINKAGINFSGHTEHIANFVNIYFNTQHTPIMMLMGRDFNNNLLRVALITTHIAVNKIAESITASIIVDKILIINKELQTKYNITHPRILITGLNPHSGENGSLGSEEIDIIKPAIDILRRNYNINITDPLPADSIFTDNYIDQADIIVAMYHDQGLTGFKARCFSNSANITLGLPIIRTSVDHGTALDLAGKACKNNIKIKLNSLKYAILQAIKIANNTKSQAKITHVV